MTPLQRIPTLASFCVLLQLVALGQTASEVSWHDIGNLGVEGQGWKDTKAPFDRLPAKAEGVVPSSVWGLSRSSSGLHMRFKTDATKLLARWELTSPNLAMPHMPATGVSGLDLYVKMPGGNWNWLANGRPERQTNQVTLADSLPQATREYLLYLPLYNGVHAVQIGVPTSASITSAGAWGPGTRKPILFYGTSIQQGACASRPGLVHSAILGRRFQFPHINLGFSGSGRMEASMASLFAELDPSVYVLDCLPNMSAAEVTERVEPFVRTLRIAHPKTPIVFVEDRSYSDAFLIQSKRQRNDTSRAALQAAFKRLKSEGVQQLYYISGASLLGKDNEGTVDSSHPNDLGFMRQADQFDKILRPLLKRAVRNRD